jgi:FlaA1/EpsC-like NDP-sugar epimerase
MPKAGKSLTIDMGSPVKIINVAEQMIRQAGYIPYKDINIKITGLRHGENDSEPLLFDKKKQIATPNKRLYIDPENGDFPVDSASIALMKLIESERPHLEVTSEVIKLIKEMNLNPILNK